MDGAFVVEVKGYSKVALTRTPEEAYEILYYEIVLQYNEGKISLTDRAVIMTELQQSYYKDKFNFQCKIGRVYYKDFYTR